METTLPDEKIDEIVVEVLAERGIAFEVLSDETRGALFDLLGRKDERIMGTVLMDDERSMIAHAKGQIRDILTEAKFHGFETERPEIEIEVVGTFIVRGELFDQYKSLKATADELLEFGNVSIETIEADRLYEFNLSDEILKQNPVMISVSIPQVAIDNVDRVKLVSEKIESIAEKSMLGTNAVFSIYNNIETPTLEQTEIRAGVVPGVLEFVERRYDEQNADKHSLSVYQDLNGQRLMLDKNIDGDGDVFRAFGPYDRDDTNPPVHSELALDEHGFVSGAKSWEQAETILFSWANDFYGAALSKQLDSLKDSFESRMRA